MTTNNHTPVTPGASGVVATVNSPLGELDAAIGNRNSLTTTDKSKIVAAINEARTKLLLIGSRLVYFGKVKDIFDSSLISYLPLSEPSGSVICQDYSGNGFTGIPSNVTLGVDGIGDGLTAAHFNGISSFINWYSSGFASAFNGEEGTIALWARVNNAGVWTDGIIRRLFRLFADNSNTFRSSTTGVAAQLSVPFVTGGTNQIYTPDMPADTNWFHLCVTWSKSADRLKCYINGIPQDAGFDSLGTWAGTLLSSFAVIGANATIPTNVWSGDIAHVAIGNAALVDADIVRLSDSGPWAGVLNESIGGTPTLSAYLLTRGDHTSEVDYLAHLNLFSAVLPLSGGRLRSDGSILQNSPNTWELALRGQASSAGQLYLPVVNAYSTAEFETVLNSNILQQTVADNLVTLATTRYDAPWDGIDFDIEAIPVSYKEKLSAFIQKAATTLHTHGLILSVTINNFTDVVSPFWDLDVLNQYADRINVMVYDYGHTAGQSEAIAPRWWIEDGIWFLKHFFDLEKTWFMLSTTSYHYLNKVDLTHDMLTLPEAEALTSGDESMITSDDRGQVQEKYDDLGTGYIWVRDNDVLVQDLSVLPLHAGMFIPGYADVWNAFGGFERFGGYEIYLQSLLGIFGNDLINFWGLTETLGIIAYDRIDQIRNGTHHINVALANAAGPISGSVAPYYNGSSNTNVYSASLNSIFTPEEHTLLIWGKANAADMWTDGILRTLACIRADIDNRSMIWKTANNILTAQYDAGGTMKTASLTLSSTDWFLAGMTVSKSNDRMRVFLNGIQQGVDKTGLGAWTGALSATACTIGARDISNTSPWLGWEYGFAIINREATPTEMTNCYP